MILYMGTVTVQKPLNYIPICALLIFGGILSPIGMQSSHGIAVLYFAEHQHELHADATAHHDISDHVHETSAYRHSPGTYYLAPVRETSAIQVIYSNHAASVPKPPPKPARFI